MLKATGLTHHFENLLYKDLDFEIFAGESMAILGVSGSGKSTILNNLSTMLKPIKGKVDILDHQDIYSLSNKELLKIRRYDVGIIFQSHYLFRGFTGIENLKVACILSSMDIDEDMLKALNISEIVHQNVGELSGGQQQRLSIARVLTKKPKVIFADEPTGNLDKETAQSVMKVVFEYIKKTQGILVLATHDEKMARECTHSFLLENKRLNKI
ncbi:ABC transporter ATP-binding protein [Helicobacter sp. 13S00482-2]|uniref:ABC transporter ATP-binding protein n=1 Tax=Helicobacter sp. 13S00482-2 TaxID=1476200 RepID=UPI000BA67CBC|nr:ATP-binding cassette domain-containing protein [Helicobacter sp. 13S00482-2]PAF54133.1 ABC transporter ATP-binding protein [Helicobacter sp. 13S00482-2]